MAAINARCTDREFTGTWVLKIGQRNLFVLMLTRDGNNFSGWFERPATFSSTNSTFANMRGGVRRDALVRAEFKGDLLHFITQNASDPKDRDAYALKVNGEHAELSFDDLPPGAVMEPYLLERAPANSTVATDWEPNRLYVPSDSDMPSVEMKAIFDEDQRVRTSGSIDWNAVSRTDAQRRQKTRQLLAQGALHTGKDYEEASFVFQHGDTAQDYLVAHTLAVVAVSKGDPTAIWMAAATLDRYLKKIGQKQIFGTQFSSGADHHWTQEPYDRELISDELRKQLGVPSQAMQSEQLKAYQSQK
jgi:hypothetical protein